MWGHSLAVWDAISLWTLIVGMAFGAGAVFLTGLSSIVSLRASGIAQEATRQATAEAQAEGKRATEAAAQAIERAAKLEADAASARERTAALENQALALQRQAADAQAEAAQAATLAAKVQQAANWRIIQKEQSARLVAELAKGPGGRVTISYPANDQECLFVVAQIEGIFRLANAAAAANALWTETPDPRTYAHNIFWGLRIFGQNDAAVQSLRAAFLAAGIETGTEAVPNVIDAPGMRMGLGAPAPIEIFVGPKLPPNFSP
jgi:hypothetical protein